jgi:hypothetical protein
MESQLVAPIDYVEQPADQWPRIFKIIGIVTLVYGAFFAAGGAMTLRQLWICAALLILRAWTRAVGCFWARGLWICSWARL